MEKEKLKGLWRVNPNRQLYLHIELPKTTTGKSRNTSYAAARRASVVSCAKPESHNSVWNWSPAAIPRDLTENTPWLRGRPDIICPLTSHA